MAASGYTPLPSAAIQSDAPPAYHPGLADQSAQVYQAGAVSAPYPGGYKCDGAALNAVPPYPGE
jgi:hypothetical protein